jgi:hypothetical protein
MNVMHTIRPSMANDHGRFRGSRTRLRSVARVALTAAGIGLCALSVAHAQEDDEEMTLEQGIIHNLMTGLGATNMENRGIDYRERSPLVVPPKLDLPPPETSQDIANVPNWPKDADEMERKRLRAAARKKQVLGNEGARPLMPDELAVGRTKATRATEPLQPGATSSPMLSPSQLGFNGDIFSTMFGGSTTESKPFTEEPTRETLTQPPPGYQTPSSAYAYGTGPKESTRTYFDIMQGKEVKN